MVIDMWMTVCYICNCLIIPDDIEAAILNNQQVCICLPCAVAIGKKEKVSNA